MILRRALILGGVGFLLCILQGSFFSRLKPFVATPDLILGATVAVMMLDNKRSAAVFALGAGFFLDCIGGVTPAFSPVFYLAAVALIGLICDKVEPKFLSFGALLLPSVLLRGAFTFVNVWFAYKALPPFGDLAGIILPEILSTLIFCLPLYFLIKLCVRLVSF